MFVGIILALAGCATVSDLRQTKPVVSGYSSKKVSVFTACILDKWSSHSYLQPVIAHPFGNGNSLQFNDFWRGTVFVLDITVSDNGSKFMLFRSKTISFYEDEVISCE
jgi:hypothetical protein